MFDYENCIKGEYVRWTSPVGNVVSDPTMSYMHTPLIILNGGYSYFTANLTCTYIIYDIDKNPIGNGVYNKPNTKITLGTNAYYLIINTHIDDTPENLVVLLDNTIDNIIQQTMKLNYIPKIPKSKIDFDLPKFKLNVRNLFDFNDVEYGYFMSNGNKRQNDDYFLTNFVNIENISSLCLSDGFYNFFDENKTYISGGSSTVDHVIVTPTNAKYLKLSRQIINIENTTIYEGTKLVELYYKSDYPINPAENFNITKVVVDINGTKGNNCDYNNIKEALDDITDNSFSNRYMIIVKEGTYDIASLGVKYLGLKNYVSIIGENKHKVIVTNRFSDDAYDSSRSGFDPKGYSDKIEYALIKNMTIITKGCKCPIHVDSPYNIFAKGGTIEVDNCFLIDENVEGMTDLPISSEGKYYSAGGVNVGLRSGQSIKVKNCESNGFIYAHNTANQDENVGCYFEIINCRFSKSMLGSLGSNSHDKAVIKGCKFRHLYIDNFKSTKYDWQIELISNDIDYIKGKTYGSSNPYKIFDDLFDGKFAICDSNIHNLCYNGSSETIMRGTLVQLKDINNYSPNGIHVEKYTGGLCYGMALENIQPGSYGIIQFNGVIEKQISGTINIGDEVEFSNDIFTKKVNGKSIGIALESGTDSIIEIRLKRNF